MLQAPQNKANAVFCAKNRPLRIEKAVRSVIRSCKVCQSVNTAPIR